MNIAVTCDHGGFPLKDQVLSVVREAGHVPLDLGTFSAQSVDYPDYAEKAGQAIQKGSAERAIVICGSGVGACIAANKMKGIYAGMCHDTYSAHQGVEHDNMNVLCLGARIIGVEVAREIVKAFLAANFQAEETRLIRRFEKVKRLEAQ